MSIYKSFKVKSRLRAYSVHFVDDFERAIKSLGDKGLFFIVDKNVAGLYRARLKKVFASGGHLIIEANEKNKTLEHINLIIKELIEKKVKRGNCLVAIGGGIIQDITAFTASVLYRGMEWVFFPTTLLAQADSCIGSKTSVNIAEYKNQVGNFYPPRTIYIDLGFLKTLSSADVRSGLGEVIKVHLLDSPRSARYIAKELDAAASDNRVMADLIERSLRIKKRVIEIDEFDTGYRNIMNYGHTFGHALESVTGYRVSHGEAVTVGMDIANYISWKLGYISEKTCGDMRSVISKNMPSSLPGIDIGRFRDALMKDKKNVDAKVAMILTRGPGRMFKEGYALKGRVDRLITGYFKNIPIA